MWSSNCLTEEQIAQLLENQLSTEEIEQIRIHVEECKNCEEELVKVVKLFLLDEFDLLPVLEGAEQQEAIQKLNKLFEQKKGFTDSKIIPLGGVITGKYILDNLSSGLPMVASKKNLDDDERNDTQYDSYIIKNNSSTLNFETMETSDAPKRFGKDPNDILSNDVLQPYPDTCAIRSQELILRDFGIHLTHDDLVREAMANDWYIPGGGTMPQDVGRLLENHGVPVQQFYNANIFTLTSELAQGHEIIVGVDAGELWNPGMVEWMEDTVMAKADHALIVAGIDTTDPNNIQVILKDPGTGDVAKSYSFDQFIDAWNDSGCFMVSTQWAAPADIPEMINFDYGMGHIEQMGQIPYVEFEDFYNNFQIYQSSLGASADSSEEFGKLCSNFASAALGELPFVQLAQSMKETVEEILSKTHPSDEHVSAKDHVIKHEIGIDHEDNFRNLEDPYDLTEDESEDSEEED